MQHALSIISWSARKRRGIAAEAVRKWRGIITGESKPIMIAFVSGGTAADVLNLLALMDEGITNATSGMSDMSDMAEALLDAATRAQALKDARCHLVDDGKEWPRETDSVPRPERRIRPRCATGYRLPPCAVNARRIATLSRR